MGRDRVTQMFHQQSRVQWQTDTRGPAARRSSNAFVGLAPALHISVVVL